jgi:hypothetical protein
MADSKRQQATKDSDPTIRSTSGAAEYPDGTHPPAPIEKQDLSAANREYREMDDKPSPDTVAQVEVRSDEK